MEKFENLKINQCADVLIKFLATLTVTFWCIHSFAQDEKFEINGYVNYNQSITTTDVWTMSNTIHNRLNTKWYADSSLTVVAELRNRVFYGDQVRINPFMPDMLDAKTGVVDLNLVAEDSPNWIATTMIDRLYFDYMYKNTQLTIGRQRINWGRCLAWNPSDVFNTASYFDVDYIEKAGSDALRFQYYIKNADKIEVAAKLDQNNNVTTGILYKTNKHNYDWQFITGVLEEQDAFLGFGWEGYIKSFSFRGETNYFYPYQESDTSGIFIASIGTDYMTENDIFLQMEIVYSQYAKTHTIESLLTEDPMLLTGGGGGIVSNVKTISFDEFSALISAQYSITPLLSSSISGMYFANSKGYFISPNISYSLSQNCDISLLGQYFNLEVFNNRESFFMIYGLLSYNF